MCVCVCVYLDNIKQGECAFMVYMLFLQCIWLLHVLGSHRACVAYLIYSSSLPTKLLCLKLSACHMMTASASKNGMAIS